MSEFSDRIRKIKDNRTPSCTGAYKIKEIYSSLKKNKRIDKINLNTFRSIVRTMGKNIAQLVIDGNVVTLPTRMGKIMILERTRKPRFINGYLFTDQMIDWDKTVKLWEDDDEARTEKILVRYTNDKRYRFVHDVHKAEYKNKYFFKVRFNTQMTRKIYEYAKQNNVKYHTKL